MAKKIFKEGLRMPLVPGLIASFVIGTIFWAIIQKVLFGSIRIIPPPWTILLINYTLPLLFFFAFPMVKTSIKGDILTVGFSMGRYWIEHIPLNKSISCKQAAYSCSIWQLILPIYYYDDIKKVSLPGYKGTGVLLTYTKEKFFSGEQYTSSIFIPTRKSKELTSLIDPFLPPQMRQ